MIPTYTNAIRKAIIDDYISANLVAALINYPSLGLTDSPSATELAARRQLDLSNISTVEIGGTNLNGYARQIITLPAATDNSAEEVSSSTTLVTFTASGGDLDPFTHIILITGADLTGASPANGNNRGNNTGTIVYAEPAVNAPVTVLDGLNFQYNFSVLQASKTLL